MLFRLFLMHYLNVYLPTHLGVLFYLFVNNINYYKRRLLRYVKIEAFFLSFYGAPLWMPTPQRDTA